MQPARRSLSVLLAWSALSCGSPRGAEETARNASAEPPPGPPLLSDITREAGLAAPAEPWPDGVYFLPEIMQGGVALLDHDGDGDLDILQARIPPPGQPGAPAPNHLYERGDDGRYREVGASAGIADTGFGQGIAVGDADNDGDLDVYFANYGRDALYENLGDGSFRATDAFAELDGERWSTGATFCDYDGDGDLDLYVVHYVVHDPDFVCQDDTGRREYCGPQVYLGEPDRLYRNRGDGTFEDVTGAAGIVLPDGGERARGMGVVCADLTGDGRVDFYVSNDGESNQLWVNGGDGTFSDQAVARGVAVNRDGRPEASMGVAVGDADGNGLPDLFTTHLVKEHNTLYTATAEGIFLDATLESGLGAADWDLTGFGCGFVDVDNDGDDDLVVANGRVRRGPVLERAVAGAFWNAYAEPDFLYLNRGDGVFEVAASGRGGLGWPVEVSRGLAFGDLDRDGDVDVVVANADNTLRVYRNDAPAPGAHWLRVRALVAGRAAHGARVTVVAGGRRLGRFALSGYSYGSTSECSAHFGLGQTAAVERLEVLWPDGTRERFEGPEVDRVVVVRRGEGEES